MGGQNTNFSPKAKHFWRDFAEGDKKFGDGGMEGGSEMDRTQKGGGQNTDFSPKAKIFWRDFAEGEKKFGGGYGGGGSEMDRTQKCHGQNTDFSDTLWYLPPLFSDGR